MGRVSSYKKPKAANDPERYEKFLFGERYNNAPTKGKQKMSVSEKRQRRLMARVQGKPDPFAEPAKNQSTVDSGKATQTKAKTTNGSSEAQTESQDSDSDSENAAATGPQTEAESEANEDEAPRKVARIAQSVDGSSQQTASDRALNAKISADVKRREGETMKEYKNRLKRETNRVIKVRAFGGGGALKIERIIYPHARRLWTFLQLNDILETLHVLRELNRQQTNKLRSGQQSRKLILRIKKYVASPMNTSR